MVDLTSSFPFPNDICLSVCIAASFRIKTSKESERGERRGNALPRTEKAWFCAITIDLTLGQLG